MVQITHTGLEPSSLTAIQQNITGVVPDFVEVYENELAEFLLTHPAKSDVLLIGEKTGNPIKIAQAAHAADNQLSIIIINDEGSYRRIKQALLFTPFIGNTVQCVSNTLKNGLASITESSLTRTQQRRSYARLQSAPIKIGQNTHIYESIRSEFLDKFLEGAPIGAVLLSQEGLVLAINRYATHILLKTEKETLGHPFAALFPEQLQTEINSFISQSSSQTLTQTFERKPDNQIQHLEIRVASISASEKLKYIIGIINDHTDKIEAQKRIEKQLQELAQTNESLKRVNADLDAFVYTASHDLRAPISNIEGLIKLLEERVDISLPKVASIFSMIKISIDRFQDTIKDLTDVALIQKNQEADEAIIDIKAIIEEVKSLIGGMIVSSEAKIIVEAESCRQIRFSRTNFKSIIYNLLTNAIKYRSPERSPIIRICTKKTEKDIILSVEDNGLGIADDKRDKIFTMFQRLHTHIEGTGIGLFIVKRIIDNSGGRVDVESTPGLGTTFKIHLPQKPGIPAPASL